MDRREFVGIGLGAAVASALGACLPRRGRVPGIATSPIDAATFHAMRRYADTSFGRIAYVERGRGPAALFLHGYPLNGFQWRGALERQSPWRRCIAPDFMGLGYSEIAAGQSLGPEAQADMLDALLHSLAIDAVDVVANDSGGAIAQLFVARHPARVRTLLLTNCDVPADSPPASFLPIVALARAGTLAERTIRPALDDKPRARGPRGIGGLAYVDPTNPTDEALETYFRPLVSSATREAQLADYALALGGNVLEGIGPALARWAGPARIVWGTGDTVFRAADADWLDRTLPGSRGVRRVPGAKLFFPEEYPALIAQEARRLWEVG